MFLQSPHGHFSPGQRIVSLVPSQTELLHWLGLEQQTVGITKFCVHPAAWFATKARIGGTKTVNLAAVEALQPTLIIANREENVQDQVEALAERWPVWLTDVNTLPDALQMIADIGSLTGTAPQAAALAAMLRFRFGKLQPAPFAPLPAAYLIWRKPYMAAGGGTFINDMLTRCGLVNIFAGMPRYPEVTAAQLRAGGCRLLLLSSEPYPFREKHIAELQAELPGTTVLLADGECFSWYGSRLLLAPGYFLHLSRLVTG